MNLQQLENLQVELEILSESIEFFQSTEFFPSTYQDLVDRYNELILVKIG